MICFRLLLLQVLDIHENILKLKIRDDSISLQIMYLHNLIQFFLGYVMTHLVHRGHDVFLRNLSCAVGVELVEESLKRVVVEELFHVESCNEEFTVVDFAVAKVVDF